ncbi:MAG: transposase [Thermoguttaceae bacterium]|nr:transposase [Thermoguttaceae bacterium]
MKAPGGHHRKTYSIPSDVLLSWYAYPISTGPLEGMNNKIKTLKRRSYGFRDPTYFRLKILNIHQTRYALVG